MSFRPQVNDQLAINGVVYSIAEHPAAPGVPYGQAGRRAERLVYGSPQQLRAELRHLEDVLDKAEKVTPSRDNKLQRLLNVVLKEQLRLDPKVIIFTRYVDTMNYLKE